MDGVDKINSGLKSIGFTQLLPAYPAATAWSASGFAAVLPAFLLLTEGGFRSEMIAPRPNFLS